VGAFQKDKDERMRKTTLLLSCILLIITALPSTNILAGVWVEPNSFDITTIEGCVETRTLTIGNDGLADLTFLVRTRQVPNTEMAVAKGGGLFAQATTSSIPQNHDFTVAENVPYKADELIVRFGNKTTRQRISSSKKAQILDSFGGARVKRDFKIVPGLSVVKLPAGMTVEATLKKFNQSADILYAQPNYEVHALSTIPNDTRFNELWGMNNTGQSGGTVDADIDAPEAWDIATGSGKIVVAVIDTGVDYTHPDLAANMWTNQAELNGTPGVDDDHNGYIDDIYGYDFCNNDGNPMDDHYHGTHCAGTIGAVGNNSQGVTGVCWNVKIMALKFLNSSGSGYTEDAIRAVEYSTLMGAKLSSNSWGGGGYSQGLKDAIDAAGTAGMLFVAAAGNDGTNNDIYPHYPSSYDSDSLISVMATDASDNRSSFSNYGPVSVDLGAPGSSILSCQPGNRYQYLSGTSMATPHVAGACALVWSINSSSGNTEVKNILLQTVDKTLTGLCVSQGRLNLYNAILETRAPWIKIKPEEGSISPGDSNELTVSFDATMMAPGTYKAEIVIISNDPCSPAIIPVTMQVNPDDLSVSPDEGFESSGTEHGPFTPACITYTLTNNGTGPVNWTATEPADWLTVTSSTGVLEPAETIDVSVCIDPNANLLDPNVYNATVVFTNTDSNSIKPRMATLTVKPPDYFTESFNTDSDLEGLMLTFSPDGSVAYYEACREKITAFPTDPNGSAYIPLGDDDFAEVVLNDNKNISFYGTNYDRFYIGSNGYITFSSGDTEYSGSLASHFELPRISGVFTDLSPVNNRNISYEQFDDRVVVTFQDVPGYGDKTSKNSFQIEMFFADGTICISYLNIDTTTFVAGLSKGAGLPPAFFVESDLIAYPICWPYGDFNRDYNVNFKDFTLFAAHWMETDCDIPYWCGKSDLDFSSITDITDLGIFAENWLAVEDWWLQPIPIAHWKLDEGSGTIAYDSAGSYDGTLYGDPTWTTGQIDGALDFNGGDYVDITGSSGTGSPLNIYNKNMSISAWAKFRGAGGTIVARAKGYYITYRLGISSNQVYINTYKQGSGHWFLTADALVPDTWYHLVGVFDRDGDLGRIYINGVKKAEGAMTIDPLSNDASTKIGCRNDTSDDSFNGIIDDVRIYNQALSAEEIWQLYREGLSKKASNPNPADGEEGVDPNVVLSWSPGKDAITHDVYFGTNYDDVNNATPDSNEYIGNFDVNSYNPNGLALETTYYWRIDEISPTITTKGDVWSFTTELNIDVNLVSWWKFDEGTGTIAYDSVGSYDGTLYGDPTWTTGQINGALDFNGGDNVNITGSSGTSSPLNIYNKNMSISAWVNFRGAGTIVARSKGYYITYRLAINADNRAYLNTYKSGIGHWVLTADEILVPNTWYHLVGVFDRDSDVGSIYINGVKKVEGAMTTDPASNDASTKIGCRNNASDDSFNGKIDDVRIYNRALSAEVVEQLYQQGLNP
jgi:subtilisin family serine protease